MTAWCAGDRVPGQRAGEQRPRRRPGIQWFSCPSRHPLSRQRRRPDSRPRSTALIAVDDRRAHRRHGRPERATRLILQGLGQAVRSCGPRVGRTTGWAAGRRDRWGRTAPSRSRWTGRCGPPRHSAAPRWSDHWSRAVGAGPAPASRARSTNRPNWPSHRRRPVRAQRSGRARQPLPAVRLRVRRSRMSHLLSSPKSPTTKEVATAGFDTPASGLPVPRPPQQERPARPGGPAPEPQRRRRRSRLGPCR